MIQKNEVIEILETCYDPEIPIDLWNLGLIYNIEILDKKVEILMTLTTPGCTMVDVIADNVKTKLLGSSKIDNVEVKITFEPTWEPNMMTEIGKEKLGLKFNQESTKNDNWE
jgi:metal-sulfur cluster biosynthetic enzyme